MLGILRTRVTANILLKLHRDDTFMRKAGAENWGLNFARSLLLHRVKRGQKRGQKFH